MVKEGRRAGGPPSPSPLDLHSMGGVGVHEQEGKAGSRSSMEQERGGRGVGRQQPFPGFGEGERDETGLHVATPSSHPGTKCLAHSSNKPLSSRFRGVCWNKKNRRWQAAINSGGKYLYLGSFLAEDDAAKAFDRAAIKLRGRKAKVNFEYNDYVDESGELLEDIELPLGGVKEEGSSLSPHGEFSLHGLDEGQHSGRLLHGDLRMHGEEHLDQHGRDPSQLTMPSVQVLQLAQSQAAMLADGSLDTSRAVASPKLSSMSHLGAHPQFHGNIVSPVPLLPGHSVGSKHGQVGHPAPEEGSFVRPDLNAYLPAGCKVDTIIPGLGDIFGALYGSNQTKEIGCVVWDGVGLHNLGTYALEKDARQACNASLAMLQQFRRSVHVAEGPQHQNGSWLPIQQERGAVSGTLNDAAGRPLYNSFKPIQGSTDTIPKSGGSGKRSLKGGYHTDDMKRLKFGSGAPINVDFSTMEKLSNVKLKDALETLIGCQNRHLFTAGSNTQSS